MGFTVQNNGYGRIKTAGSSLSKNYPNGPVSGIIEETGVFSWKTGEKTHGES